MFFLLFIYLYLDGVLRHFVPLPVKLEQPKFNKSVDFFTLIPQT